MTDPSEARDRLKPLPGRDGVTLTEDIEVGWHLHPDAQGNDYATEAARAVLEREFATGTPRVYAVVMAGRGRTTRASRAERDSAARVSGSTITR